MIGQTLGGKYSIVRLLGEGGMGAVYEARHLGTGRRVALKVITGEVGHDARMVSRFEREARAAGAIESEHIAQVLDVGHDEASGAPFLAMELLLGEDLAQVFARLGPMPADVVLRIGVQACLGLEKAHAAGIVHRDIKPANLFLARRDNGELVVKILDFGIAKVEEGDLGPDQKKRPLTRTGSIVGSPLYMSPEQARYKGRLDHRTDVWSLGIVLYQALAGRTPLEHAESIGDFIVAVSTSRSLPLRSFAPWVDAEVASTIERCLAIDPEGRYANAAELREALSVYLPGGTSLRASMLVRAPEAGPPPPPSEERQNAATAAEAPTPTPATVPGQPLFDRGPSLPTPTPAPVGSRTPSLPNATPMPTRTEQGPLPGMPGWAPSAHGPLVPLSAVVNAAPIPAPPRPAPKRGKGPLVAALLILSAFVGLSVVYALGLFGGGAKPRVVSERHTTSAAPVVTSKPPPVDLSPLTGAWWAEAGLVYDGFVVGETVELRLRDDDLLPGQGYATGEPVFVLRASGDDLHELHVEMRVRPPPPRGYVYDRARAAASCVVPVTQAAGKPLQASMAIDRLVIQSVKIDPPSTTFTREGLRVVGCTGLGQAPVTVTETLLGRTQTQPPPKWVPPRDAGVHDAGGADAGIRDAGAPSGGQDAGPNPRDPNPRERDAGAGHTSGRGYGAPCSSNATCASRRCVSNMCR